ncbi:hypothetical protein, conserved [Plasmodium gonderi]|uniref:Uncharacterized protein n=1 Tax=Plasmodium gonderi TaxID=77519 RepID=A0A1Y1JK59_PLAGO|nr:hypothetical protein, conserved [Plasmodium gonderi]GAW81172.1 hypothetical protein, conserved [Plasmodium gonderi]
MNSIKCYGRFLPGSNLDNDRLEEKYFLKREQNLTKVFGENISNLKIYNVLLKKRIKNISDGINNLFIILSNEKKDSAMFTVGGRYTTPFGILLYLINDLLYNDKSNYKYLIKFSFFEIIKNRVNDKLKRYILPQNNIIDVDSSLGNLNGGYSWLSNTYRINQENVSSSKLHSLKYKWNRVQHKSRSCSIDNSEKLTRETCLTNQKLAEKEFNNCTESAHVDNFIQRKKEEKYHKIYTKKKGTREWDPSSVKKVYLTTQNIKHIFKILRKSRKGKCGMDEEVKNMHNNITYEIYEFNTERINRLNYNTEDVVNSSIIIIVVNNVKEAYSLKRSSLSNFFQFFLKIKENNYCLRDINLNYIKTKSLIIKYLYNLYKLDHIRGSESRIIFFPFELNFLYISSNFNKYRKVCEFIYSYLKILNKSEYFVKPNRKIKYVKSEFHKIDENIYMLKCMLNYYSRFKLSEEEINWRCKDIRNYLIELETSVICGAKIRGPSYTSIENRINNILNLCRYSTSETDEWNQIGRRNSFYQKNESIPFFSKPRGRGGGSSSGKDLEKEHDEKCEAKYDEKCEAKYDEKCEAKYDEKCEAKYDENCEAKRDEKYEAKYDEKREDEFGEKSEDSEISQRSRRMKNSANLGIHNARNEKNIHGINNDKKYMNTILLKLNMCREDRINLVKSGGGEPRIDTDFSNCKKNNENCYTHFREKKKEITLKDHSSPRKRNKSKHRISRTYVEYANNNNDVYNTNDDSSVDRIKLHLHSGRNFLHALHFDDNNSSPSFKKNSFKKNSIFTNKMDPQSSEIEYKNMFNNSMRYDNLYDKSIINHKGKEKKFHSSSIFGTSYLNKSDSSCDENGDSVETFLNNIEKNKKFLKNISELNSCIKKNRKIDKRAKGLLEKVEKCLMGETCESKFKTELKEKKGMRYANGIIDNYQKIGKGEKSMNEKTDEEKETKKLKKKTLLRESALSTHMSGINNLICSGKRTKSRKAVNIVNTLEKIKNENSHITRSNTTNNLTSLISGRKKNKDKFYDSDNFSPKLNHTSYFHDTFRGNSSVDIAKNEIKSIYANIPVEGHNGKNFDNENGMSDKFYDEEKKKNVRRCGKYPFHLNSCEPINKSAEPIFPRGKKRDNNIFLEENKISDFDLKNNSWSQNDGCKKKEIKKENRKLTEGKVMLDEKSTNCNLHNAIMHHGKLKCERKSSSTQSSLHKHSSYSMDCPSIADEQIKGIEEEGDGDGEKEEETCGNHSDESVFSFSSKNRNTSSKCNYYSSSHVFNDEIKGNYKSNKDNICKTSPNGIKRHAINNCNKITKMERNKNSNWNSMRKDVMVMTSSNFDSGHECLSSSRSGDASVEPLDKSIMDYHNNFKKLLKNYNNLLRRRHEDNSSDLEFLKKIKFAKGILREYKKVLSTKWNSKSNHCLLLQEIISSEFASLIEMFKKKCGRSGCSKHESFVNICNNCKNDFLKKNSKTQSERTFIGVPHRINEGSEGNTNYLKEDQIPSARPNLDDIEGANMNKNVDANLDDNVDANLDDNMDAQLDDNMDAQLDDNVDANLDDNMDAQLDDNMDAQLDDNVDANLDDNVDANLDDNVYENMDYNVDANLDDNVYENMDYNVDRYENEEHPNGNCSTTVFSVAKNEDRDSYHKTNDNLKESNSGNFFETEIENNHALTGGCFELEELQLRTLASAEGKIFDKKERSINSSTHCYRENISIGELSHMDNYITFSQSDKSNRSEKQKNVKDENTCMHNVTFDKSQNEIDIISKDNYTLKSHDRKNTPICIDDIKIKNSNREEKKNKIRNVSHKKMHRYNGIGNFHKDEICTQKNFNSYLSQVEDIWIKNCFMLDEKKIPGCPRVEESRNMRYIIHKIKRKKEILKRSIKVEGNKLNKISLKKKKLMYFILRAIEGGEKDEELIGVVKSTIFKMEYFEQKKLNKLKKIKNEFTRLNDLEKNILSDFLMKKRQLVVKKDKERELYSKIVKQIRDENDDLDAENICQNYANHLNKKKNIIEEKKIEDVHGNVGKNIENIFEKKLQKDHQKNSVHTFRDGKKNEKKKSCAHVHASRKSCICNSAHIINFQNREGKNLTVFSDLSGKLKKKNQEKQEKKEKKEKKCKTSPLDGESTRLFAHPFNEATLCDADLCEKNSNEHISLIKGSRQSVPKTRTHLAQNSQLKVGQKIKNLNNSIKNFHNSGSSNTDKWWGKGSIPVNNPKKPLTIYQYCKDTPIQRRKATKSCSKVRLNLYDRDELYLEHSPSLCDKNSEGKYSKGDSGSSNKRGKNISTAYRNRDKSNFFPNSCNSYIFDEKLKGKRNNNSGQSYDNPLEDQNRVSPKGSHVKKHKIEKIGNSKFNPFYISKRCRSCKREKFCSGEIIENFKNHFKVGLKVPLTSNIRKNEKRNKKENKKKVSDKLEKKKIKIIPKNENRSGKKNSFFGKNLMGVITEDRNQNNKIESNSLVEKKNNFQVNIKMLDEQKDKMRGNNLHRKGLFHKENIKRENESLEKFPTSYTPFGNAQYEDEYPRFTPHSPIFYPRNVELPYYHENINKTMHNNNRNIFPIYKGKNYEEERNKYNRDQLGFVEMKRKENKFSCRNVKKKLIHEGDDDKNVEKISIKTIINRPREKTIPCINYDTDSYNIKLGWWNWGKKSKLFSNIERYKENIKKKYYENRKFCKNRSFSTSTSKYFTKFQPNEYLYIPVTNKNYFKSKTSLKIRSNPVSDFHKLNLKPITGFMQSYKKEKERQRQVPRSVIRVSTIPYVMDDYNKHKGNQNMGKRMRNKVGLSMGESKILLPDEDESDFNNTSGFFAKISKNNITTNRGSKRGKSLKRKNSFSNSAISSDETTSKGILFKYKKKQLHKKDITKRNVDSLNGDNKITAKLSNIGYMGNEARNHIYKHGELHSDDEEDNSYDELDQTRDEKKTMVNVRKYRICSVESILSERSIPEKCPSERIPMEHNSVMSQITSGSSERNNHGIEKSINKFNINRKSKKTVNHLDGETSMYSTISQCSNVSKEQNINKGNDNSCYNTSSFNSENEIMQNYMKKIPDISMDQCDKLSNYEQHGDEKKKKLSRKNCYKKNVKENDKRDCCEYITNDEETYLNMYPEDYVKKQNELSENLYKMNCNESDGENLSFGSVEQISEEELNKNQFHTNRIERGNFSQYDTYYRKNNPPHKKHCYKKLQNNSHHHTNDEYYEGLNKDSTHLKEQNKIIDKSDYIEKQYDEYYYNK